MSAWKRLIRAGIALPLLLPGGLAGCGPRTAAGQVRVLLDRGEEAEAEARAREELLRQERAHGLGSIEAARALDLLVEVRWRRGLADEETLALAERALGLKESLAGADPLELVRSLVHLARTRATLRDLDGALEVVERAHALGPDEIPGGRWAAGDLFAVEALARLLGADTAAGKAAAERSLDLRRKPPAAPRREISESLLLLSYAAQQAGERERCVELRREVLAIRERALGPDHPETAAALSALGEILLHTHSPEARPVLGRALAIFERTRPEGDRGRRVVLNNLALAVQEAGDLQYARRLHERRLALPGAGGIADLAVWQNLGFVLWQLGELEAAREAYERAVSLAQESGATPDGLAIHQHNLAFVLTLQGRYHEARDLLETALEAQIEAHGPDDPRVVAGLELLGNLLRDTGDLLEARRVYERAVAAVERRPDAAADDTANLRFHLAEVRWGMGDLTGAREELEEAVAGIERTRSPNAADTAVAMERLADLLLELGEKEEARRLLLRLRELHARQQGKAGARVARVEARLAALEGDPRRRVETLATARRRLAVQYGDGHPDVAALGVSLAAVLLDAGDPDAARRTLEDALEAQRAALGPSHPDVARTEIELGKVLLLQGDPSAALRLALRGERAGLEHLHAALGGLPERDALTFARTRPSGVDLAVSVALHAADADAVRAAWTAVIQARARVLDEMAARQRLARLAELPEAAAQLPHLLEARSWLARLLVQGPDASRSGDYPARIAEALKKMEQAEAKVAAALGPLREDREAVRAGWEEVAAALPPDGALLAFLRHGDEYVAFVQAPGAEPALVRIGDTATVDSAVADWREAVAQRPPAGRGAGERDESIYLQRAVRLGSLLWEPLAAGVAAARTIFIVPDGSLFRVNFATLTTDESTYLLESGPLLHLLAAERDLVGPDPGFVPGKGLLLVGPPDFGPLGQGEEASSFRSGRADCAAFSTLRLAALPGAARETERLAEMWDSSGYGGEAEVLAGSEASEDAVRRQAPGRRILHLATHGFFLDRGCAAGDGDEGRMRAGRSEPGDSPLVLSGLALAGFNRRAASGDAADDGVLTSQEIAALDLSGVQWAVLSACDTGAGRIHEREGVLGLQRAFRTAGVRSLLMSLWPVEDEAARGWMERLYGARAGGASTAEAVRRAALETLQARRRLGLGGHPFYWGAFVASGDWR